MRISTRAKSLEAQDQLLAAREEWLRALPLLPANSTQAEWIRGQVYKLELAAKVAPPPQEKHSWARKLGPLAPIAILLAKSKTLLLAIFKLKFLFSLFAFMGVYWALFGPAFGVGFVVLILVHEMGHYIDIRRRGLPADMPVFLPGLGAYVRWQAIGVTRQTRAAVSMAGPLAGFLGAAVCATLWYRTGNGLWAALARSTAGLNILNLIPVWVLDGGQAAAALSKTERFVLLAACLLLWLFIGEGMFFLVAAGVDGIGADVVVGVVMHVVGAADSVTRLHVETDAVALFEHHRCRPNFHLHLDDLAGLKIKAPFMAMVRAIRQRKLPVELAMGHTQPALRNRNRAALLSRFQHVAPVRGDVTDREKQIHVLARTRHPQHRPLSLWGRHRRAAFAAGVQWPLTIGRLA